jgi:hypothetical protein
MSNFTTTLLVLADLLAQPITSVEPCVNAELGTDCSLRGIVQVRSIDPRRFLIAVDAEPSDGRVDHLFLFVGSSNPMDDANPFSGLLVVRFDAKRAEVQRTDNKARFTVDFGTGSLAHYWGYGDSGGRLEDLEGLKESDCGAPGLCWEAEGWRIRFPH